MLLVLVLLVMVLVLAMVEVVGTGVMIPEFDASVRLIGDALFDATGRS